jgi:hypothetical protein
MALFLLEAGINHNVNVLYNIYNYYVLLGGSMPVSKQAFNIPAHKGFPDSVK